MARKKPRTKAGKQRKFGTVMREFESGTLHSGSKRGPIVTNPRQAQAIAASVAGIERKKDGGKVAKPKKGKKVDKLAGKDSAAERIKKRRKALEKGDPSGGRLTAEERKAMGLKKGGKVRKRGKKR